MFKTTLFASALIAAVSAWESDASDKASYSNGPAANNFSTEAYGVDNQNYGHQGYGKSAGYGKSVGNNEWAVADNHNSYRQTGHQGQGHNQWTDNAWNQWGVNNHFDTQKSVDNKWGNNSGKVNVNLNSVSGHYDNDYGQQQRGLGYEGHQNTSGEVGYELGMGGHSFGYEAGDHSYGYENNKDWGYGGWANNLGAYNHGANYDNFGNQFHDNARDITNDVEDTHDIKENRRVGAGYADLEELDQYDARQDQYDNVRVGRTGSSRGIGRAGGIFGAAEFSEFGVAGAKFGSHGSNPALADVESRNNDQIRYAGDGVRVAEWKGRSDSYAEKEGLIAGYRGAETHGDYGHGYNNDSRIRDNVSYGGAQNYEDDKDSRDYGYGSYGRSYGGVEQYDGEDNYGYDGKRSNASYDYDQGETGYAGYGAPQRSYYAEPQRSYYAEPERSYYAEPQSSYYAKPQSSYYAEPQSSYYAKPQSSYYAKPQSSYSAKPQSYGW